ncbi:MAG: peptidylprolyl isomerase [Anaerolineae bacterium]
MGKQTQALPPKELTRKQLSRRAKDEQTRRLLLYSTGLVIGLVVLVLAYGLLDQYYLRPRRPVASVNGSTITHMTYDKRLAYREWDYNQYALQLAQQRALYANDPNQDYLVQLIDQQLSSLQTQIINLPSTTLDELIEELIVRQESTRRGIVVTADEITSHLEEQFGYNPNPPTPVPTSAITQAATLTSTTVPVTATPAVTATVAATATSVLTVTAPGLTPTGTSTVTSPITVTPAPTTAPMTREQFEQTMNSWLVAAQQNAGFTESDLRQIIEAAVLREKLQQAIGDEVPTQVEQVHARHILLTTQVEAQAALDRLKNGEDFGTLAEELSQDTASATSGGDLGWFTKGMMLPEFEAAAFSLPVGQLSDVVQSQAGFHIILVIERQASRELEGDALLRARSAAVENWFSAQRASPDIKRFI